MKKTLYFIFLFISIGLNMNAQSTASKQVSTFKIEAPQLNTQKTIWVYTPKSYETSVASYAVIYMFDAQNSITNTWVRDVYSQSQFAIPNYLTPRVFNVRTTMKF